MKIEENEFDKGLAPSSSPKLAVAERDVARAKAKLSAELESASHAGRRLATTVVRGARPALIGVAVLTGVGLVVAVWRQRRGSRAPRVEAALAPRSFIWELARAAVVALASSAGRHLAAKLVEPLDESFALPGRADAPAVAPSPDRR